MVQIWAIHLPNQFKNEWMALGYASSATIRSRPERGLEIIQDPVADVKGRPSTIETDKGKNKRQDHSRTLYSVLFFPSLGQKRATMLVHIADNCINELTSSIDISVQVPVLN